MTRSIFHGAGYMLVDDRASGGKRVEADMLGCNHCQALIPKAAYVAGTSGSHCLRCDGPMCNACIERSRTFGCETFIKKFTHQIDQDYLRQQNYKVLGI